MAPAKLACKACRLSKVKCDAEQRSGTCSRCERLGLNCVPCGPCMRGRPNANRDRSRLGPAVKALLISEGGDAAAASSDGERGARSIRHLFLLAGQSNMAGRGRMDDGDAGNEESELDDEHECEPDTRIHVFRSEAEGWQPARHPLHQDKPAKAGIGPGLAFARAVVDFLPPNESVGLVACAVGGSPISQWAAEPAEQPGELFRAAVATFAVAAKATADAGADAALGGVLWHQGESDCAAACPRAAEGYATRLRAVVRALPAACGAPCAPVILGELGLEFLDAEHDARFHAARAINRAIVHVGSTAGPSVSVVSARGLGHVGDQLHFSARAANELGVRYAWRWLELTGRVTRSLRTLVTAGAGVDRPLCDPAAASLPPPAGMGFGGGGAPGAACSDARCHAPPVPVGGGDGAHAPAAGAGGWCAAGAGPGAASAPPPHLGGPGAGSREVCGCGSVARPGCSAPALGASPGDGTMGTATVWVATSAHAGEPMECVEAEPPEAAECRKRALDALAAAEPAIID